MDSSDSGTQKRLREGTEILQEVRIAADRMRVWEALTSGIHNWWSHSFSEKPARILMDARIGGFFCEHFDGDGNGALYGTVSYCMPGVKLCFSGVMGMQGPVTNFCCFSLEEVGEGTLLRISQQVFGMVSDNTIGGYSAGWQALLGQLKDYIESGKGVR